MRNISREICLLCLFLLLQQAGISQSFAAGQRTVALLDLTLRNAETTDGELYSAEYILKVSGIPYRITTNIDTAKKYGMILASSKLDVTTTLTTAEKDTLIGYVNSGGVLVAPNVRDSYFYSLFGISGNTSHNDLHLVHFKYFLNDPSFKWLNDTMEQTISLGDTAYPTVINSRTYSVAGALALAEFENTDVAITKNFYGAGKAYALGFSFRNLILTNQLNRDYDAQRVYSNGFEPTSDALVLFIKGIYVANTPKALWLHTSPYDSKTTLMITHDVDATSAYDTMSYYSDYENSIGLKTTYLFTTHYVNDGLLSDFYNLTNLPKVQYVLNQGHIGGSHSVGHFPDFDDELVFPMGAMGNTSATYVPYNSGSGSTTNGTVLGETEVSKELLESNFGITVKTFRAGYLCFNDKLPNALDTLGYQYNTTFSAGDVLTNFPYRLRKDRSASGAMTGVWEIPMTISDVFNSSPITSSNYPQKVATWLDVISRNMENNAPNVLLIHPTRYYKLYAQQDLINQLPAGVFVTNLEEFAGYWKARDAVQFTSEIVNDTLIVTVPASLLPLDSAISFIVDSGQLLSHIKAQDDLGNPLGVTQSNWNTNDLILHFTSFPVLNNGWISAQQDKILTSCFPNPAYDNCTIEFRIEKPCALKIELLDILGNCIQLPGNGQYSAGWHKVPCMTAQLSQGVYFYRISSGDFSVTKKIVVAR